MVVNFSTARNGTDLRRPYDANDVHPGDLGCQPAQIDIKISEARELDTTATFHPDDLTVRRYVFNCDAVSVKGVLLVERISHSMLRWHLYSGFCAQIKAAHSKERWGAMQCSGS